MKTNISLGSVLLIFGLLLCAAGFCVLLIPARYRATARVAVKYEPDPRTFSDPWFIQCEFEVIQSRAILTEAIKKSDLLSRTAGGKVNVDESIRLLQRQMSLRSTKEGFLEISVIDKNPDEAARLANSIGECYRDYQTESHRENLKRVTESQERAGAGDSVGGGVTSVRIVAPAVPQKSPMFPNRSLGIISLLVGLAMSVTGRHLRGNMVRL